MSVIGEKPTGVEVDATTPGPRARPRFRRSTRTSLLNGLRSDSNAIAMFCAYVSSPTYGWGEFCEQTFGDVPAQIAFDWNTPRHTSEVAVPPGRRAFTQKELQKLFDYQDDLVDREYAAGISKAWITKLRSHLPSGYRDISIIELRPDL